ncbi:hypothetical protein FOMPIDRAFT_49117 [Fomitopsis schrenkii]|uniref:Diphthine--ammonia ligase n=1 Tax=Fomitopsis schrenkii TaxID=2126942 RepID=S8EHP2_FOMSC|nr:hypothetical protein FOMPIDRAFT_49117 [Fomitopsis schrenkii]
MKYVALLSGGKDSCYNLLHCAANGHQLIAAASLCPEQGKEELDSYLYQTVGQDAIQFVAEALEVPLCRKVITGSAVEQGNEYGGRSPATGAGVLGDETEDLYSLLCDVKRDQAELLSEMIAAGMDAIIIKVAGIGLKVTHLGKTLADMQPTLRKLVIVSCDCPLFKRKIKLTETETVIHSDNGFATVAYLRVKNAALEQKYGVVSVRPEVPPVLSGEFVSIRHTVAYIIEGTDHCRSDWPQTVQHPQRVAESGSVRKIGRWVTRALILEPHALTTETARLATHGLTLSNCANINIFLSSMDLFARVNAVYATYFGSSPPARACVAVDLPGDIRVKLDAVAFIEQSPSQRQALHVQGLSYWAPANIGPYSQAIVVHERIFISGQIGLIPSSLTLPSPLSLALETALSFQHVHRVTTALQNNSGGGWEAHQQGVLYWLGNTEDVTCVRKASETYTPDATTPLLYAVVAALPKGAQIEKQVLLHTGRVTLPDEDDELIQCTVKPVFEQGTPPSTPDGARCQWEVSSFKETDASVAVVCFRHANAEVLQKAQDGLRALGPHVLSIRLFYNPLHTAYSTSPRYLTGSVVSHTHIVQECHEKLFQGLSEPPPATLIPCRHVASRNYDNWDYAMFIVGS